MRRFSAAYLRYARDGMWDGDRSALDALALDDQRTVLDAGAGTGAFTRVLREETPGDATVVAVDADPTLLARADPPRILGDATRLPVRDGGVDLVACQALLVNLPEPVAALREFRRAAADRVAAVEPDNAAVAVDSTVEAESALSRTAREAYRRGSETDVAIGDATGLFEAAGFEDVTVAVHHYHRVTEPPYSDVEIEAARRKARATRLDATRETLLDGGLSRQEYEAVVEDWRSMGRTVVDQMADDRYRRAEVVPYYVTVGKV